MLITCSQHFSNYLMNKLLMTKNFKIIERVYMKNVIYVLLIKISFNMCSFIHHKLRSK